MKKLVAGLLVLSACNSGPNFSLRQSPPDHSHEVRSARLDLFRRLQPLSESIRAACQPSHHSIPLGTQFSAKTVQPKNRN